MDWHHLIYKTYVCLLQPFPLVQLSALRLVEISCCLAPDDVSATEHSASPVLLRGTHICTAWQPAIRHSNCINIINF